jgi:nitrile hydratase beta subunit
MNGVHDMGGLQGFGPVAIESDEPLFHHAWERRALGLTLAMGGTGAWNIDMSRAARESLPPARYLSTRYYGIWVEALGTLLKQRGLITDAEWQAGHALQPAAPIPRVLTADRVAGALARGSPTERPATTAPRFETGARVRTRNLHPVSHTRLPRYCRDKAGTIAKVHGVHVFADSHALGQGEDPQWLYSVRFDARTLWGADTTASAVHVDCWESYLVAADGEAA